MVVDIDGFVSVRLQQDHGSIVTIESKTDLDRNLQSLSERGSEPSDRKLIPVSRQIYRSCERDGPLILLIGESRIGVSRVS
jgi:hypothetical protein